MPETIGASNRKRNGAKNPRSHMVPAPEWVCPQHGESLLVEPGLLRCRTENHSFPVLKEVPRFVTDQQYAEHFGIQWKRYRCAQLDSHTGVSISEDRLKRILGPLCEQLHGLDVLEAGCGAGRFTEILLLYGARVTSIDFTVAVEANAENFPASAEHRIAQADIMALPFRPRQFDVVACLGVVQHTPDSGRTIGRLWDQVRPGGWLVVDHYRHLLSWYTKSAFVLHKVLRRLQPETSLRITEALVRTLYPLHRALRHLRPLRMVLTRISPVQTYHDRYPALPEPIQYEWSLLDTHDSLTPWYTRMLSLSDIQAILHRLPEKAECEVWKGGNCIEARVRRKPD